SSARNLVPGLRFRDSSQHELFESLTSSQPQKATRKFLVIPSLYRCADIRKTNQPRGLFALSPSRASLFLRSELHVSWLYCSCLNHRHYDFFHTRIDLDYLVAEVTSQNDNTQIVASQFPSL